MGKKIKKLNKEIKNTSIINYEFVTYKTIIKKLEFIMHK